MLPTRVRLLLHFHAAGCQGVFQQQLGCLALHLFHHTSQPLSTALQVAAFWTHLLMHASAVSGQAQCVCCPCDIRAIQAQDAAPTCTDRCRGTYAFLSDLHVVCRAWVRLAVSIQSNAAGLTSAGASSSADVATTRRVSIRHPCADVCVYMSSAVNGSTSRTRMTCSAHKRPSKLNAELASSLHKLCPVLRMMPPAKRMF